MMPLSFVSLLSDRSMKFHTNFDYFALASRTLSLTHTKWPRHLLVPHLPLSFLWFFYKGEPQYHHTCWVCVCATKRLYQAIKCGHFGHILLPPFHISSCTNDPIINFVASSDFHHAKAIRITFRSLTFLSTLSSTPVRFATKIDHIFEYFSCGDLLPSEWICWPFFMCSKNRFKFCLYWPIYSAAL